MRLTLEKLHMSAMTGHEHVNTGMARGREAPEADTRSVSAGPCPTIGNTGVQKRSKNARSPITFATIGRCTGS